MSCESVIKRSAKVVQELVEEARKADLVILGASDQRFFRHRLFEAGVGGLREAIVPEEFHR